MRTLEQYIKESETTQIDEGFIDFLKSLKNIFKASGEAISQNIHTAFTEKYPNFIKAFDELQKADAEDKELIQKFNTMYETVDKMKDISDDEKVFQKLNLVMAETRRFKDDDPGEGVKKLDKDKHKGYLADLQKKLKDIEKNHKEIYDKYQEAAKKDDFKKEDVLGNSGGEGEGGTQDPKVVDDVTKKSEGIAKATDGNHEAVVAAVKKFLGVSESLNEGKNSEEYRVMFSKENDPKGEKLLALTILLDAWKGLAKQLDRNDKPEQLLPFIQALFANTEFTTEFKK